METNEKELEEKKAKKAKTLYFWTTILWIIASCCYTVLIFMEFKWVYFIMLVLCVFNVFVYTISYKRGKFEARN